MKHAVGKWARIAALRSLGAGVLAACAVGAAAASVVVRAPFVASTAFEGLPCTVDAGDCLSFQGSFGFVSDGRGTLTAVALDGVEGESKPPRHEDVLELVLGESIGFYFRGRWAGPAGAPAAAPAPSVFAFAAGTSLAGLLPPAAGTPEVPIGRIEPRLAGPFEATGLLVGFDAEGAATLVGRWSVRLAPGTIPEPGTALLALAGLAGLAAAAAAAAHRRQAAAR